MYSNWINVSEGIDINKLFTKSVRFVIAGTYLNILVLNEPIDIYCPNDENLIVIHEKIQKSSKFYVGYDLLWFAKPLVIKFPGITGYTKGYDLNIYLTIINNEK